jgi:hypothetical protein
MSARTPTHGPHRAVPQRRVMAGTAPARRAWCASAGGFERLPPIGRFSGRLPGELARSVIASGVVALLASFSGSAPGVAAELFPIRRQARQWCASGGDFGEEPAVPPRAARRSAQPRAGLPPALQGAAAWPLPLTPPPLAASLPPAVDAGSGGKTAATARGAAQRRRARASASPPARAHDVVASSRRASRCSGGRHKNWAPWVTPMEKRVRCAR